MYKVWTECSDAKPSEFLKWGVNSEVREANVGERERERERDLLCVFVCFSYRQRNQRICWWPEEQGGGNNVGVLLDFLLLQKGMSISCPSNLYLIRLLCLSFLNLIQWNDWMLDFIWVFSFAKSAKKIGFLFDADLPNLGFLIIMFCYYVFWLLQCILFYFICL